MTQKILCPSLLSADFLHLAESISVFEKLPHDISMWHHLDIMDGHFVPNLTFGPGILQQILPLSRHPFDAHFMVERPDFFLKLFSPLKLHNVTFHLEAFKNIDITNFLQQAKTIFPSVGLSIKPHTPLSDLSHDLLKQIDLLLIMTVEPGFGGQSFMPHCLDKIEAAQKQQRILQTQYAIQVDGGINETTLQDCLNRGATHFVAGSAIYKGPQTMEAFQRLQTLLL
jgi:ribulose-phosphate 3-epimerase